MPKPTQQQTEERLEKLPKTLRDALFDTQITEKVFEISNKNNLTVEQAGLFGEEVGNIILGFTRPEELAGILRETLAVSEEDAKAAARDVNQEILLPLRSVLRTAYQMEIPETEYVKKTEPVVSTEISAKKLPVEPLTPAETIPKTIPAVEPSPQPAKPKIPMFMRGLEEMPKAEPEWIIRPELKQEIEIQVKKPWETASKKEIQTSPASTPIQPVPPKASPTIDLKKEVEIKPLFPSAPVKVETPPPTPTTTPVATTSAPAPLSKIPPIDLRQIKPEIKSAVAESPPKPEIAPEDMLKNKETEIVLNVAAATTPSAVQTPPLSSVASAVPASDTSKPPAPQPKTMPDKGIDAYREPI